MTDIKNNGPGEEQLVIDKQYKLQERSKAIEIIKKAMGLAREEIPNGKVATYIPELGKVDPHQLGIVIKPLKGEKICMGDYDVRFTMQSVCKVIMLMCLSSYADARQCSAKWAWSLRVKHSIHWWSSMSATRNRTIRSSTREGLLSADFCFLSCRSRIY